MFWRWVTTGCAAVLGFVGVVFLDCTYLFFESVDAIDICVEADIAIPGGSITVGTILLAAGIALLGYAWIPYFTHIYKEKEGLEETSKALVENVHRLPEEASGPVEKLLPNQDVDVDGPAIGAEEVSVDLRETYSDLAGETTSKPSGSEGPDKSLLRRVELLETILRDETVAPGPVAKHWIESLREANELHQSRAIDEATFEEANSRLLAMYVSPDDDIDVARRKVGWELIS